MPFSVETLAAEPRWDLARTLALPGKSRGDLVGPWGKNVRTRFGADALARIRKRLPLEIPDEVSDRDWLPVYAQLLLTEAIVDEALGGNMLALAPLLVEDTRAGIGRVKLALLRAVGARRAFEQGAKAFSKVHERGSSTVEVSSRRARLTFRGTPLFGHPTWRLLQLFAMQTMLELAGTPGTATGESGGPDDFVAVATW